MLPSTLQERREFESQIASGALFEPSEDELQSARQPAEFNSNVVWKLEPEYYADGEVHSVHEAIDRAATQSEGNIFLVCDSGSRLNLSFNDKYAVCEYQNDESDEWLYAYTADNLREQVPESLHIVQACPCCGEGMGWYPSRFHMPRTRAFEIFKTVAFRGAPAEVQWLRYGEILWTSRGHG